jgi:phasin protein/hemerythrin HHE cation binding domain-containing protein
MELAQLFKDNHVKTIDLFDKLAETSDGAVKTRERLFTQLKATVEAHARAVEQHLLPLLRGREEFRELEPPARERSQIDETLAELDRLPKDDESFLARLRDFRKQIEQQLRDGERRIAPALKKALSEGEAAELTRMLLEGTRDALEAVVQGATGTARKAQTAAQAVVEDVADRAGSVAKHGSELAYAGVKIAAEAPRRLFDVVGSQNERVQRSAADAAEIYSGASRSMLGDVQALMSISMIVSQGMQEAQRAWLTSLAGAAQAGARASQGMWRCTDVQQLAELQSEMLTESMNGWLRGSVELLRISGRVAEEALRPVEERVRSAEPDDGGRGRHRVGRAA